MTLTPDFSVIDSLSINVFRVGCGLSIIPSVMLLIAWTSVLFSLPRNGPGPALLLYVLLWGVGEALMLLFIWVGYMALTGRIQERRAAK
ncbi:hypothetical protein [Deinococcus ruber]|nr:hypothetical protein [Deinococcus ruber]